MGVGGQRHAQATLAPGQETYRLLYRRLSGPLCQSVRVLEPSSLPGFDPLDFPDPSKSPCWLRHPTTPQAG
jgi:hypothetical protein